MIPELPEKDGRPPLPAGTAIVPAPPPVEPQASSQPRLTDLYEQEVLDLVTDLLEAGDSEDQIVAKLRRHKFADDETRHIVRTLAKEVSARQSAAVAAATAQAARHKQLTDQYEQEVLDYVTNLIESGHSEDEIVEELRHHKFTDEETRVLARALAKDLPAGRLNKRRKLSPRERREAEAALDQAIAAEIAAGQRDMGFGALWFFGGFLLTVLTFAASAGAGRGVLFYGAMIWGPIQFFRGVSRVQAAKNLRR